ncbi:MAG: RNA polymerase factor sigma-54 [Kiritimatiellae bacterium]|nr:RNA polymerase factor sigma-54 [Kiritimatiellia bacterium]
MPGPSLSLTQSQQLQMVLAPQLRQSLEMLQLPIMELSTMIQQELEQNPTIEEVAKEKESVEIEPGDGSQEDKEELDFEKEFEVLAKLDDEWRDYFFQNLQNQSYTPQAGEKHQFMLDSLQQRESLQEHLVNQLSLSGLSEEDVQIGELIIGNINDDGYLTATLENISESAAFDVSHIEDILGVVHDFHPTGVGARDLRECLLMQLERMDKKDSVAARIVRNHLTLLAGRKFTDIARILKVLPEEAHNAAKLISSLDPKPGRIYSEEVATYILPEVIVQKLDGEYVVILNDEQLPHIRISRHYRGLLKDDNTKRDVKSYIRERIRAGAFLIKSIHQRQKTIERIASEIVKVQKEFLDFGVSFLKPMTMAKVATTVGVHETTVSRAVSGKYMRTPSGIFDMKYFFTPGIKTKDGTQISNKSVKNMIANMVADEPKSKPLSDQVIMERLKGEGVDIARRTVAKYRLVLRIPPSHMRRSY